MRRVPARSLAPPVPPPTLPLAPSRESPASEQAPPTASAPPTRTTPTPNTPPPPHAPPQPHSLPASQTPPLPRRSSPATMLHLQEAKTPPPGDNSHAPSPFLCFRDLDLRGELGFCNESGGCWGVHGAPPVSSTHPPPRFPPSAAPQHPPWPPHLIRFPLLCYGERQRRDKFYLFWWI